ncbi:MAG: methyl-accepting chemotaxis protein [Pseudomonadota bacterium]
MRKLSLKQRMLLLVIAPMIALAVIAALKANAFYDALLTQRVQEIQRQTDTAITVYEAVAKDAAARGEDPVAAGLAAVSAIRYGENDYFFALRGTTMLAHPKASLIGQDLVGFEDPNGVPLFAEFDRQINASGEAIVEYGWPRASGGDPVSKISYARLVPGQDFYFGTGVYTDDIDAIVYEQLFSSLLIGVLILGSIVAVTLLVYRSIYTPLSSLKGAMDRLTAGDVEAPIADTDAPDEFGAMARAVDTFRANAAEVRSLTAARDAEAQKAAEDQQRLIEELNAAFGEAVNRAVAGDLSARVTTQLPDPALNDLATNVNRLLEAVNDGVSETSRVMGHVAQGGLDEKMNGAFQGAFAELQSNVNQTVERLAELVGEISQTSGTVTRGAAQITDGAEKLAAGAEQQASSLEETAATMEEMAAAVKTNADNSGNARELAADASRRANSGGEIVKNAVDAMTEIDGSATKIADIIAVIDGIAFQTNLLALNAAVEAARAGDAGKGFAVVASEVRALAQRSSDASRDIRELIETSAGQVSRGVDLVKSAGEALEGIVGSISQVETAIDNIASASVEQASGVEEVSATVSNLDQLTQQNSAMAERSASNARALGQSATKLNELVRFFKVAQAGLETAQDDAWSAAETGARRAATPSSAPAPAAAGGGDWAEF